MIIVINAVDIAFQKFQSILFYTSIQLLEMQDENKSLGLTFELQVWDFLRLQNTLFCSVKIYAHTP